MTTLDKNQMIIYREQPYRVLEITSEKKLFQTKWEINAENLLTHKIEKLGPFTSDDLENVSIFKIPEIRTVEGRIEQCSENEIHYTDINNFEKFTVSKCDCSVDLAVKRKRFYTLSFLGRFLIGAKLLKDTDGPIPSDLVEGQMFIYDNCPYKVLSTREYQGHVHTAWEITAKNLLNHATVKLSGFPDSELKVFDFAFPTEYIISAELVYCSDEAFEFMEMDTYEMISVPFCDCRTNLELESNQSYTLVFLDRFLIDAK